LPSHALDLVEVHDRESRLRIEPTVGVSRYGFEEMEQRGLRLTEISETL
jgi:hypothetical protein